jgi:hypothetical protein
MEQSSDSEESEEEDLAQVDGGKLSQKSRRAVKELINQKFVFPNMNILLYAENHIFPMASQEAGEAMVEQNRDKIYNLYNLALQLEPERKPELSFAQRMIVNKARSFITKRMKKRIEVRKIKQDKKQMKKVRMMLSDKMME